MSGSTKRQCDRALSSPGAHGERGAEAVLRGGEGQHDAARAYAAGRCVMVSQAACFRSGTQMLSGS
jgi:hypothetical protein